MNLVDFVRESNGIEGIVRRPTDDEIEAHRDFMALVELDVDVVMRFVRIVADAPIRDRRGMDVYVGEHVPPRGGPEIPGRLAVLLNQINRNELTPWAAHVAYETLHPMMDGNGRSGRVVWAWHMAKHGHGDPFRLGFLHAAYYQALQGTR